MRVSFHDEIEDEIFVFEIVETWMNLHKKGWDPVLTKFQHFVIEKYFKTRNHFKTFLHTVFFCKLFDDARQFHSMCLDTKDAELVLIDQNLHQMSPYAHMIAPSWGL